MKLQDRMKNKSRNFFLKAKPISLSPSFRKMLFMDFYLMEFAFSPVGGATAAKILTSKKNSASEHFCGRVDSHVILYMVHVQLAYKTRPGKHIDRSTHNGSSVPFIYSFSSCPFFYVYIFLLPFKNRGNVYV